MTPSHSSHRPPHLLQGPSHYWCGCFLHPSTPSTSIRGGSSEGGEASIFLPWGLLSNPAPYVPCLCCETAGCPSGMNGSLHHSREGCKMCLCSGGAAKPASASCPKGARRLGCKEPSGPSCSVSPLLLASLFRLSPFWKVCTRPVRRPLYSLIHTTAILRGHRVQRQRTQGLPLGGSWEVGGTSP